MPRNKRKPATASSCSCCEVSPSPAKQAKPSPMPRTLVSPALQLAHQDIQSTETAVPASSAVNPGVRPSSSGINSLHRHTVSTGNVVSYVHESSSDESDDATTVSERSSLLVRSKVSTVNIPSTQSPRPLLVDDSDFDTEPESMNPDITHTNLITVNGTPYVEPISTSILDQIKAPLKKSIWANKVVDMSLLLSSPFASDSDSFSLQVSKDSTISIQLSVKTKKNFQLKCGHRLSFGTQRCTLINPLCKPLS
ncbi:hypothetical protein DPMN_022393 [Dreissena polymorpha]|uniref:Uncharacterized protein n=1 Tax=Dreissena polymorpha TaxID=45954 RepID=A0A9D4NQ74_DREPO|nr:hypothetical protein DPMN_022393 [Dreissena polymorpha]